MIWIACTCLYGNVDPPDRERYNVLNMGTFLVVETVGLEHKETLYSVGLGPDGRRGVCTGRLEK